MNNSFSYCICSVSFFLLICISGLNAQTCPTNQKVVVCYYASWGIYRPGNGTYKIEYIYPEYCTHLVYTFAGLNLDGIIDSLDYSNDITNVGYKSFNQIKENSPCVKTLLAIGGWNEGSEKYSLMVETEESRDYFAERILRFLVHFGFDGLDIDWEYPTQRGGIPEDKENFVKLLENLRPRLQHRKKLLTIAVSSSVSIIKAAYAIPEMCQFIDFVMIMGYDLNDDKKASVHAPLKREATDIASRPTVDDAVQYFLSNGCPANKLVLGVPAFGRSYLLKSATLNGLGAAITGPGKAGPYLAAEGTLGFNEICEGMKAGGWTTVYLKQNAAKYSYKDKQWVSYDDIETATVKAKYAKDNNLAGVMIWSIDTDDFHGNCFSQSYPILTALNAGLK